MIVSALVAMNGNRLIGVNNELPWKLKDDLEHFKNYSLNKPIIMGRNTYESIGRPLPNRINIVVSSKMKALEGLTICRTLEEALQTARNIQSEEAILIGGSKIFLEGLSMLNKLVISWVDANHLEGDVFFPVFDINEWEEVSSNCFEANQFNEFKFRICEYVKKK
tara:strand:- start:1702 stop:2196 length:495 start_codon:yes stop_codon:yes gene_type:complete